MEFDYSYLRGFITENFGTNKEFARFLGISENTLSLRLHNKIEFSTSEIKLLMNEFDLTGDDIVNFFFREKKIRKRKGA